ncbi:MAG: PAS domain-containing sensor histidine kinase [Holosporaceae bacterium]|jgi:PAS domain S-box-containing protein|nr:PAS domain-containing sensor histidine kinase [Holosporaceae bacterium]
MLKKAIATLKSAIVVWGCILVPLFISSQFMKSAFKGDAQKCIDTFIHSEGLGISKYMSLQFESSLKELKCIMTEFHDIGDQKSLSGKLKSAAAHNNNIVSLSMYDGSGKFLANSIGNAGADLSMDKSMIKSWKNEIFYQIGQQKDESIIVTYTAAKTFKAQNKKEEKKIFFEVVVKWDNYEKYMMHMFDGSFPRVFYIISPDCRRYVSMNLLPENKGNRRNVMALGMYLTKSIGNIPFGLSSKKVEAFNFRIFKDEVKIPKEMQGNKFFVVVATDKDNINAFSRNMFNIIPNIMIVLTGIWLLVCLIVSRFYNKTKELLEIADVISSSTSLAIVIFRESNGKIMKINLSASMLLRIELENMDTINMWNMFIEENDRTYIVNAISSNMSVLNYEVMIQTFGGGNFWSICSASPIEVDGDKYIVLAVLDINRRKEVEKKLANNAALLEQQIMERTADLESKAVELEESNLRLKSARKVAEEANNAKSKFLTNISNELKTPVNAIIGYGEILEEEALDRKDTVSASDLGKIVGSAKHLLSLINEILDLATIEAGKTQLYFENIDIISLIKDVEGVAMPLVTKNDNSLSIEVPKGIGTMYSDSTKLRQCLLNLLSNAAKFTDLGKVTLRVIPMVRSGEDFIEFSVMDTGIGIDPERIDTIFGSFQNSSKKNSGIGLGLSLTKKYVEFLGGSVKVESTLGGGSKFSISVPRVSKVVSNEFIDVKNQKTDEVFEEFLEDDIMKNNSGETFNGIDAQPDHAWR